MVLLNDLGSQVAEHLDRRLLGMLGVDDATLPEFVRAQQPALTLGHARDGFGSLDLLPHESRPRSGSTSCSRGSHELQISPFVSSSFQRLLDLAHFTTPPTNALRRASPKGQVLRSQPTPVAPVPYANLPAPPGSTGVARLPPPAPCVSRIPRSRDARADRIAAWRKAARGE